MILYPNLRKQDEVIAPDYVVFRGGLENVAAMAIAASRLSLVTLSRAYAEVGSG